MTVFQRYGRVWKAGTLDVNRCYLRNQLLPHFTGRPIADIDRQEVRNWFARLRATPVAADRSMPVLSVIMREAERMGMRPEGSNPCRGIRRYRRKGRARFLSDDEIRRLSARLTAHEDRWPRRVAVIRLLLLTGCRKSEILTLRWSDYREATCSCATARRDRGQCRSAVRPKLFSAGSRALEVLSCFPLRSTLLVRAVPTLRSGIASAAMQVSRTVAFTTSGIPWRATPS